MAGLLLRHGYVRSKSDAFFDGLDRPCDAKEHIDNPIEKCSNIGPSNRRSPAVCGAEVQRVACVCARGLITI